MYLTVKQHQALYDLRTLIVKYGYWSEEVKEFNSKLDYNTMTIINNKIKNESEV